MKSLWTKKEEKLFSGDPLSLRVFSSRLLGRDPELVLHGGGNTSMKGTFKTIFGDTIDTLFIKGSGWDLISIEKEGFAPVDLKYLQKLATLDSLSDSQMVREQRLATLDPHAPNPSVEAILHALIPFTFVDHTHANAVLSITNSVNGNDKINQIYGDTVLVVPYVMPGFILAKKISELTKNVNWDSIKGMILLNHGVFSFGNTAKSSYENMIEIVHESEEFLRGNNVWRIYKNSKSNPDLITLAKIRKKASEMRGLACLGLLNNDKEAAGFSKMSASTSLSVMGTVTPDHVIRTKPFAWVIDEDINQSSQQFIKNYTSYFEKHKSENHRKLDNGPKWALWKNMGTICFGNSLKEASTIMDINKHTIRTLQTSHKLGGWSPIPFKDLFEVEYWELEQAKLKTNKAIPEFQGKIAVVTGAAGGIGKACSELLLGRGCVVVGLDKNESVKTMFPNINEYMGIQCELLDTTSIRSAIEKTICSFGGMDILISNAGAFPESQALEKIDDDTWSNELNLNLGTHHKVMKACIPYLKYGIHPSIIFIGSRNVGAPGPGAGTYSIAKSGLTQMARLGAIEFAKHKIRVNMVHPDCVYDTGVWTDKILKTRADEYGMSISEYKNRNLLKKEVLSSDVAELVCFLSGEKCLKTTGAQIPIDGGNDRII